MENKINTVSFEVGGATLTVDKSALLRAWLAKALALEPAINPPSLAIPELPPGERYIGAIISADGAKREHIILLSGEAESVNHGAALKWAASIGGDLPNRCESILLFDTLKDEFKPEWYWTNEGRGSDNAWMQAFNDGGQYYNDRSYSYHARAVRRLKIS